MNRFRGDPETLRNFPPFAWFSDEDLRWAMPSVQRHTYSAGLFIQRTGEPADGLYILLSGRVQLLHLPLRQHLELWPEPFCSIGMVLVRSEPIGAAAVRRPSKRPTQ